MAKPGHRDDRVGRTADGPGRRRLFRAPAYPMPLLRRRAPANDNPLPPLARLRPWVGLLLTAALVTGLVILSR